MIPTLIVDLFKFKTIEKKTYIVEWMNRLNIHREKRKSSLLEITSFLNVCPATGNCISFELYRI